MTTTQAMELIQNTGIDDLLAKTAQCIMERYDPRYWIDDLAYAISEEVSWNPALSELRHDPIDCIAIATHYIN